MIGLITCTGILVLLVTIILRIIAGGVLYKRKQKKPDSPDSEKGQHESQSQSAKVETDGDILEHKLESTLQSDSGDVSDTDETVPAATPGSRYVPVEKVRPHAKFLYGKVMEYILNCRVYLTMKYKLNMKMKRNFHLR